MIYLLKAAQVIQLQYPTTIFFNRILSRLLVRHGNLRVMTFSAYHYGYTSF